MSGTGGRSLRVLAWPAAGDRHENPYGAELYSHLSRLGVRADEWSPERLRTVRYDLLHLHWPDLELLEVNRCRAAWRVARLVTWLLVARARGVRIVWTIHNLHSHERWHPLLEAVMYWWLTRLIDAHISLTAAAQSAAYRRFPALRRRSGHVVPHGHFRDFVPRTVTRDQARRELGLALDAVVVAFFGRIRAYKNAEALVRAFRALGDERLRLVVAGRPQPASLGERVAAAAAGDPRILLRLEFVPTPEVQQVLMAADLVVLPYTDVLNSGAAILALSFDRPVLAPAVGSLPDLEAQVGGSYVRTYSGPLTPDVLADAVAALDLEARPARPDLSALEWPVVAELTLRAYRATLER